MRITIYYHDGAKQILNTARQCTANPADIVQTITKSTDTRKNYKTFDVSKD